MSVQWIQLLSKSRTFASIVDTVNIMEGVDYYIFFEFDKGRKSSSLCVV